jgi:hypothetical protein
VFSWNFNGFEAAQGNHFSNMDARLDIPVFNLGTFKIGRQKVGLSQEWLMPGVDMVFYGAQHAGLVLLSAARRRSNVNKHLRR